ncbi:hypothetical protein IAU59_003891 [Kwoniella sp. CBS 9459]
MRRFHRSRSSASSCPYMSADTSAAYLKVCFDEGMETLQEKATFLSTVFSHRDRHGESTEIEARKFFQMVDQDRARGQADIASGQLTSAYQCSMWERQDSTVSKALNKVVGSQWYREFERARLQSQSAGPETPTIRRLWDGTNLGEPMSPPQSSASGLRRGGMQRVSTVSINGFKWALTQQARDDSRAEILSTCSNLSGASRAIKSFQSVLRAESQAAETTECLQGILGHYHLTADDAAALQTGDEDYDKWIDTVIESNNKWIQDGRRADQWPALQSTLHDQSQWFKRPLPPQ